MKFIDIDLIIDGLFQGADPSNFGWALKEFGIDVIVLAARELQPVNNMFPGLEIIRVPLDDTVPPEPDTFIKAHNAAEKVVEHIKNKRTVLVTCHAGLNRSGLITALAVRELTGMSGVDVVNLIRSKRPHSLCNSAFENYINTLLSRTTEKIMEDTYTAFARTFYDYNQLDVAVLSKPSSTGLCKVRYGEKIFVRHVNQLRPLNEAAKNLLGK